MLAELAPDADGDSERELGGAGRLGSAIRGKGGGSTSATDVPLRTNTGLRGPDSVVLSMRGGATPSSVRSAWLAGSGGLSGSRSAIVGERTMAHIGHHAAAPDAYRLPDLIDRGYPVG